MTKEKIKVCIFNKSNNVSRFDIFKKFFECINSEISLTCCTETDAVLSKCAWQWEENGKFDIPVDSQHKLFTVSLLAHSDDTDIKDSCAFSCSMGKT